jgi:tetratricopeptide (TPR) repeat protein
MSKILLSKMLGVEAYEVAEAIQEGTKLRYIKKEDEEETPLYTLHRLVREVWKSQHELEDEFVEKTASYLADYMKEIKDEFLNFDKLEMASFQAKKWSDFLDNTDTKAALLCYSAYPDYYMGKYKNGLDLVEDAYNAIDKENDSEIYAGILNSKAYLLSATADYTKAEPLFLKALEIREKVLGEEHPDTASSYNNLALLYNSKGEYEKAEPLFLKALEIREKVLGEEYPDTAASYNSLATLYDSKSEYEKAEPLYLKALEIREKVLREEHPSTATSYNNLAGLYKYKGEYEKVEPLYLKAL